MRLYLIPLLTFIVACGQATTPENETNAVESNPVENADLNTENTANSEISENPTTDETTLENEAVSEYEDIDWAEYEKSMTKDFSFVILISTKSYEAALERAKDASVKLGYPLDLRELHPNTETGLSLPKEVCEGICGGGMVEYPQYLPRTDWGESKYVSVEYSNGFEGFTPGYYIVVVASGEKGDPIIQEALDESRQFYEDAYAKTCGVWMGCGC